MSNTECERVIFRDIGFGSRERQLSGSLLFAGSHCARGHRFFGVFQFPASDSQNQKYFRGQFSSCQIVSDSQLEPFLKEASNVHAPHHHSRKSTLYFLCGNFRLSTGIYRCQVWLPNASVVWQKRGGIGSYSYIWSINISQDQHHCRVYIQLGLLRQKRSYIPDPFCQFF